MPPGKEWLIAEVVALAGLACFFLQLLTAISYRGRWRMAALVPLVVMVPLAVYVALAYPAGAEAGLLLLVLAAPPAFLYLLLVAIANGAAELRKARGRR
jgi:hypothetical protein